MKKTFALSAAALATALVLSGCGSNGTAQSPHADHSTMGSAQSPGPSGNSGAGQTKVSVKHNQADVKFAKMMAVHHRQAVVMSDIILANKDIDPQVTDLARQIKKAQGPEINTMTGWLQAWGEPVPIGDHGMEDMASMEHVPSGEMDGMMSHEQLHQLKGAKGEEAARLFLSQMIEHHKGAVKMAQQQIENGTNNDAIALAKEIGKAQKAEIERMNELLETL